MTPEGRTKARLKRYFEDVPGAWLFWPVQMGYGAATVDCFVLFKTKEGLTKFLGIECKREGIRKPTPRQAQVMARIRAAGGVTYLVTMQEGELVWIEIK